jgi:hypothetical protein
VLLNRVSWSAVLAGVVVALVAQLILNMLGIGIGASTLNPGAGAENNPSASGLSIGAALWWTISGILAALAGGFTAGRLSGQPKGDQRRLARPHRLGVDDVGRVLAPDIGDWWCGGRCL